MTCKLRLHENSLGLHFKMRALSEDDARGCKLLHIPGVLQSPLSETQRDAAADMVLSAHFQTLAMSLFLSL